jgi:hypothetical protein
MQYQTPTINHAIVEFKETTIDSTIMISLLATMTDVVIVYNYRFLQLSLLFLFH